MGILWLEKSKRRYAEIKPVVCIVISYLTVLVTHQLLCRPRKWCRHHTSVCHYDSMMYRGLTALTFYASCIVFTTWIIHDVSVVMLVVKSAIFYQDEAVIIYIYIYTYIYIYNWRVTSYIYTYIYIYTYLVILQSSKSGEGNSSIYLNIPGRELNVNKFTEQIILFQEKTIFGHIRIINLFPSC